MRLELSLGKRRILAEYLSRAPMGNRVVGYEAAALVYLGKPAAQLSPAEAALLASVPRAPSRANPWKSPAVLEARRDAVLARMRAADWLDDASYRAALAEKPVLARAPFRMEAPHFVRRVLEETGLQDAGPATAAARSPSPAGAPRGTLPPGGAESGAARIPAGAARIVTTLDGALQSRVEALVRRQLADLAVHGVQQMAVVVLDVRRGEWLALEGSGLDGAAPGRWIDGTRAPRQPGSALKPFTYAAAFDHGFTPATVLPDIPHAFTWTGGTWAPRNYDEKWHGPVRAREALACSVNLPAAELLGAIGTDRLLEALRAAGIGTLTGGADAYGLGLTLGAGEVRLDELAQAYAALIRGGEWRPATSWRAALDARGRVSGRPSLPAPRRVFSEEAAAQVSDILADPEARAPAFGLWSVLRLPFPAAVKTGTSEGFRDNWCLGGTREVVVGVWCGNFNRAPMGNVSGVSGAGAVWREVMLAWAELEHPEGTEGMRETLVPPPGGMVRVPVCALSGLRPSPACPVSVVELLRRGQEPAASCGWHVRREDGRIAVAWPPLYLDWAVAEGLVDDLDAAASASVAAGGGEGTRSGALFANGSSGGVDGGAGLAGPRRRIRAHPARAPIPGWTPRAGPRSRSSRQRTATPSSFRPTCRAGSRRSSFAAACAAGPPR